MEHLHISDSGGFAIRVTADVDSLVQNTVITNCSIKNMGTYGIYVYATGTGSRVYGTSIQNCIISETSFSAIQLGTSNGTMNGTRVVGCTISNISSSGINIQCTGDVLNTVIDSCSIADTTTTGLTFTSGTNGNYTGLQITRCQVIRTKTRGISVEGLTDLPARGVLIENCTVSDVIGTGTVGDGIRLLRAEGCIIRNNLVSRIFLANGTTPSACIKTSVSNDNLVVGNTCIGSGANNYSIDVNDTSGPIVTASGPLATTGAAAHPWANFSL